jgi:hypothetical protein
MLTGTDATALSKKKLFRSELVHRFGFTPFYGTLKHVPFQGIYKEFLLFLFHSS